MARPFLTARWLDLLLLQYRVAPERLLPHLPPGLELDTWRGSHYVSLVAFRFEHTRVLGIPWPGHRNFPELNLRFYVRPRAPAQTRRGVVFIREFVPRPLITWTARLLYNEPYRTAPMRAETGAERDRVEATYAIRAHNRWHQITATADNHSRTPPDDSLEHHFKEHARGYGTSRRGRTLVYRVEHPRWQVRPVRTIKVDLDWTALYGPAWADMNPCHPDSVVFANGSHVAVYPLAPAR